MTVQKVLELAAKLVNSKRLAANLPRVLVLRSAKLNYLPNKPRIGIPLKLQNYNKRIFNAQCFPYPLSSKLTQQVNKCCHLLINFFSLRPILKNIITKDPTIKSNDDKQLNNILATNFLKGHVNKLMRHNKEMQ